MVKLVYTFLIVCLVFTTNIAQEKSLDVIQDEAFQLIFTDQERAIFVIDSLIEQKQDFSKANQGRNYSLKGVYYGVQNELDSAVNYFSKALELVPKEDAFYPKLVNNLAIAHKKKGNFQEALSLLINALEVAESNKNLSALHKIYSEISSCYRALNNYDLAVEYSLKAIETENKNPEPNTKNLAFEKQKLANLYGLLEDYVFAENIYKEIIDYFETSPYTDANISTYLNYANALIRLDKTDEAITYINQANQSFENFSNDELFAFLKLTQANYFDAIGEKDKAKKCFEKSLASLGKNQDNYLKTLNQYLNFLNKNEDYKKMLELAQTQQENELVKFGIMDVIEYNEFVGNAYQKNKQFKESLNYYTVSLQLKDSLQSLKNFEIAKDLQARYQNEVISQRNTILQERVLSESRKQLAILGFAIAIGILLMSFIFVYKNRLKNKSKLTRVLEEKLAAEDELINFKNSLLEQQKKELVNKSLENMALEEVINRLTQKISNPDPSTIAEIKTIKESITPAYELKKLKLEFERIYPNFKNDITEKYPQLSKNDVLFLSFIKLKFTFKEIANIFGITHQSVISKKYRITKKMELSQEIDLYEFIAQDAYK